MAPLMDPPPHLLVVQGDTSSALGGARAGFASKVPGAHVEAGLRTHDPLLPWPEERYRTLIDARADLLFAPTDGAAANLRGEGVSGAIRVTGNTAIDALLDVVADLPSPGVRESRRVLVTCHRRENWGEGLRSVANAFRTRCRRPNGNRCRSSAQRACRDNPHKSVRPHSEYHPPATVQPSRSRRTNAQCRAGVERFRWHAGGGPGARHPDAYFARQDRAARSIASGNMRLVGTATETIVAEARRLLTDPLAYAAMSRPAFPYGDGRAAPRIAAIIEQWLDGQDPTVTRESAPEFRL